MASETPANHDRRFAPDAAFTAQAVAKPDLYDAAAADRLAFWADQARTLLDLGCDIGQGTGIAAPMPAAQVGQWVRDYRGMFALAPAESPGAPSRLA